MRFVSIFVRAQSLLALARSSADFMTELRELIAADARVADADILSVHCGVVELTDRYDVDDELVNADTLVVRLRSRSAPLVALSRRRGAAGSAAAFASSGVGVGADTVAVSDDESDSQVVPAAKRAKRGADK